MKLISAIFIFHRYVKNSFRPIIFFRLISVIARIEAKGQSSRSFIPNRIVIAILKLCKHEKETVKSVIVIRIFENQQWYLYIILYQLITC